MIFNTLSGHIKSALTFCLLSKFITLHSANFTNWTVNITASAAGSVWVDRYVSPHVNHSLDSKQGPKTGTDAGVHRRRQEILSPEIEGRLFCRPMYTQKI